MSQSSTITTSNVVVCSRHLRKNVGRKLDDLVGKSSDAHRRLMDALFGTTGLVALDNVVSLDERGLTLS